jgi:hypothetical protein
MTIATLTNYDNRYGDDDIMTDIMTDSEMERLASQHQFATNGNPNKITPSLFKMINYYRNINPRAASDELKYPSNDFLKRAASLALSSNSYRLNKTTGNIDEIRPNRLTTFIDDLNMPNRSGVKSFRRKSRRRRRHNKKSTRRHRRKY